MKILFICNSLAEGKDGVGDQTRRLAIECAKRGIVSVMVAFNDRNINEIALETIENDILVHRFPSNLSLKQRSVQLASVIKANTDIEWVSLQFVSYGLNKRGIVTKEISVFKRLLKRFKLQIMFHELWVAEEKQATLKMKLLGPVQKAVIILFLKQLRPLVIHTSIPLYKKMLERAGFKASILPLFSNILKSESQIDDFKKEVPTDLFDHRDEYIVGCIFGTIYYDSWDMHTILSKLEEEHNASGKKILVSSIGKIAYGKDFWDTLPAKYKNIEFLTLGMREENFISYWLTHFVDLGIVTTPSIISGKSSSMMAFIDHGIAVFCKENELSFNFTITEDLIDKRLIQVNDDLIFKPVQRVPTVSLIEKTTQTFIDDLNEFN